MTLDEAALRESLSKSKSGSLPRFCKFWLSCSERDTYLLRGMDVVEQVLTVLYWAVENSTGDIPFEYFLKKYSYEGNRFEAKRYNSCSPEKFEELHSTDIEGLVEDRVLYKFLNEAKDNFQNSGLKRIEDYRWVASDGNELLSLGSWTSEIRTCVYKYVLTRWTTKEARMEDVVDAFF